MAVIQGQGTTFNLPNYVGVLFGLTPTETPFLSAIGGMTGGRSVTAKRFPIQFYDLPEPEEHNHLEGQDAPDPTVITRDQVENCVQIFHETINISYTRQAAYSEVAGVPIVGGEPNPVTDELTWQTQRRLEKIARDVEYAFVQGEYAYPGDNSAARKTRGILNAIETNVVDASAGDLEKAHFDELFRIMYDNGAPLGGQVVLMTNSYQKQQLSEIYAYNVEDRNYGGVNLQTLETDFGVFGVMLSRHIPQDTVVAVDLSVCAPVLLPIPGKGFLFREELAKTGASEKHQIYGEIGLQHGPELYHGMVSGLATA